MSEKQTTPTSSSSDSEKQIWLKKEIEAKLKKLRISQFANPNSLYDLLLWCDDEGNYSQVREDKVKTVNDLHELYHEVFREFPPYFTQSEKDEYYC